MGDGRWCDGRYEPAKGITQHVVLKNISSWFSKNSEANASKFPQNLGRNVYYLLVEVDGS